MPIRVKPQTHVLSERAISDRFLKNINEKDKTSDNFSKLNSSEKKLFAKLISNRQIRFFVKQFVILLFLEK